MNTTAKKRSQLQCRFDSLESRELLNAHVPQGLNVHVPHPLIAHVSHAMNAEVHQASNAHLHQLEVAHAVSAAPQARRVITGTLTGLAVYTQALGSNTLGRDTYSASGTTTVGSASISGTDSVLSTLINANTYQDLYFAGNWTMTLSGGTTLQVSYVGSGNSSVVADPYSAVLEGKAIVTSGALTGQVFDFTAPITGNQGTDAVSIRFTLSQ